MKGSEPLMAKPLDLTNQKFGKLTAISKAPSRSGKTYWLCKCECGNEKEIQTSHLRNGSITTCGCSKNRTHPVITYRQRIKIALVEAFGHKCANCGLVDDHRLYDFHHINPEEKEFGIANSSTTRSKQAYANEAKKCIMLCANCHRRIENGLITLDDIENMPFNEIIYFQTLEDLLK